VTGNLQENNIANVSGKILSVPEYSHEIYGEGFYMLNIEVCRLSSSFDCIPVLFSERLLDINELQPGLFVDVEGQFRSYNNFDIAGNKLMLTVFAREIVFTDEEAIKTKNTNQVVLNGFICKKPIYRTTPFGREITDILLAVNRAYNKSDYIPCISWGRNARYTRNLNIGDNIKIWGRVQSRKYQKKVSEDEVVEKVAYEISVSKMEVHTDNNNKTDIVEQ